MQAPPVRVHTVAMAAIGPRTLAFCGTIACAISLFSSGITKYSIEQQSFDPRLVVRGGQVFHHCPILEVSLRRSCIQGNAGHDAV